MALVVLLCGALSLFLLYYHHRTAMSYMIMSSVLQNFVWQFWQE